MFSSVLSYPYSPVLKLLQGKYKHILKTKHGLSIIIFYATTSGTSRLFSDNLRKELVQFLLAEGFSGVIVRVENLAIYGSHVQNGNRDEKFVETPGYSVHALECLKGFQVAIFCISTWMNGRVPLDGERFYELVKAYDVSRSCESNVFHNLKGICVVGFGSSEYSDFCTCAFDIQKQLENLGARSLVPVLTVDEATNADKNVKHWQQRLFSALLTLARSGRVETRETETTDQSQSVVNITQQEKEDIGSLKPIISIPSTFVNEDSLELSDTTSCSNESDDNSDVLEPTRSNTCEDGDVEDLTDVKTSNSKSMLSERQRAQLTKEGYKIVGSHSAVKMCRWTKAQMRGRGGCYKHTFYGIESYSCMEATPSLACANKCVFCWRHHKNPVGKSWKWDMDEPEAILNEMTEQHKRMVKQLKGVAGIVPERFQSAIKHIKHCALSLVGEPIMYPKIKDLLDGMHKRGISTFVVTNAQLPDALLSLPPVTQLYVSVDAASPETLRAIDRPLFSDFWDRFIQSLKIIRDIPQRTEATQFGNLILLGLPDFIEIKAVTYCGSSSDKDSITMKDIPWHDEVVEYGLSIINSNQDLKERYQIAAEHRHSCCLLIANKKFFKQSQWHTWIDYDKFFELVKLNKPFTSFDYNLPTPPWAVYGSESQGFSPSEKRVYGKGSKRREERTAASKIPVQT